MSQHKDDVYFLCPRQENIRITILIFYMNFLFLFFFILFFFMYRLYCLVHDKCEENYIYCFQKDHQNWNVCDVEKLIELRLLGFITYQVESSCKKPSQCHLEILYTNKHLCSIDQNKVARTHFEPFYQHTIYQPTIS